jgi:hypothetical protein
MDPDTVMATPVKAPGADSESDVVLATPGSAEPGRWSGALWLGAVYRCIHCMRPACAQHSIGRCNMQLKRHPPTTRANTAGSKLFACEALGASSTPEMLARRREIAAEEEAVRAPKCRGSLFARGGGGGAAAGAAAAGQAQQQQQQQQRDQQRPQVAGKPKSAMPLFALKRPQTQQRKQEQPDGPAAPTTAATLPPAAAGGGLFSRRPLDGRAAAPRAAPAGVSAKELEQVGCGGTGVEWWSLIACISALATSHVLLQT